jgi:hypothetical protein
LGAFASGQAISYVNAIELVQKVRRKAEERRANGGQQMAARKLLTDKDLPDALRASVSKLLGKTHSGCYDEAARLIEVVRGGFLPLVAALPACITIPIELQLHQYLK